MNLQELKLSTEKPSGVELPQFKGENQFFAKWSTPMVKSGHLWIALDRTHKRGLYDSLYIDSNGNGHLKDEIPVKKHCVLIDQNANGAFDDKSLNVAESDRIRIGEKGNRDTHYVGNFIEVDGELYRPEIARDGACIKLTKAKDVKFGNIRLSETVTELTAGGENGLFTLKPEKGSCSLPVGEYRINYWTIERKDEQSNQWKLQGSAFHKNCLFEVNDGGQTELDIGEPLICTLETRKSSSSYSFKRILKGRLDEHINLTRNGSQPRAPKLHIKSKDGTYDRTFSFEYG